MTESESEVNVCMCVWGGEKELIMDEMVRKRRRIFVSDQCIKLFGIEACPWKIVYCQCVSCSTEML